MAEEKPRLDPEVAAAVRETEQRLKQRTQKELAATLISEHLQRNVGDRLRGDTDSRPVRIFWLFAWILLGVLTVGMLGVAIL